MNKRILGPLVLLLSLALTFVVGEVALRLLSTHWLYVYDVEMWRYAKLIKVVSEVPGVVEEQRPNGNAFLMGARVRTESHGFRLPDPVTEAQRRPDDRIVVVDGDSLTFGWGVPEGQTYSDMLERTLAVECPKQGGRRATVHNAGIGNCNTSMEFARYKLRIRPYVHPDWVVLGFSFNDAEADPVPSTNPFLWNSALLALASSRFLKASDPALHNYNDYYKGLYQDGKPGWESAKRAFREFGALLQADHVPATLLLMPELHDPKNFGPLKDIYDRVGKIGRESGWEVIDASVDFPPGPGDQYFVSKEDAHPNPKAQALYAQALARSKYACGK